MNALIAATPEGVVSFPVAALDDAVLHLEVLLIVEVLLGFAFGRGLAGFIGHGIAEGGFAAVEGVAVLVVAGDNGGGAVEAVADEDAAQVGFAILKGAVAAADGLDVDAGDVFAGHHIAHVGPDAAAHGIFLHLNLERSDKHE